MLQYLGISCPRVGLRNEFTRGSRAAPSHTRTQRTSTQTRTSLGCPMVQRATRPRLCPRYTVAHAGRRTSSTRGTQRCVGGLVCGCPGLLSMFASPIRRGLHMKLPDGLHEDMVNSELWRLAVVTSPDHRRFAESVPLSIRSQTLSMHDGRCTVHVWKWGNLCTLNLRHSPFSPR